VESLELPRKEREGGNSRTNGQKGRMGIGKRGKEGGTEGGKGKEMEREERREGKGGRERDKGRDVPIKQIRAPNLSTNMPPKKGSTMLGRE